MLQSHIRVSRCFCLILLLLFSFLIESSSQSTITFRNTFGDTRRDFGNSVQQTTDGGYILFGLTTNDSSFNYDLYLIKTDYRGEKEWERKYGDQYFQFGNSVQQVTDGGYILCGADDGLDNDSIDAYQNGCFRTTSVAEKIQDVSASESWKICSADNGWRICGNRLSRRFLCRRCLYH